MRLTALLLLLTALVPSSPLFAQPALKDDGEEAPEPSLGDKEERVVVTRAPRAERPLLETPMALSLVDEELIQEGQQRVRLDESLRFVPGLYLQNRDNFAQGQRIAIRGAGARAPFGVRGIAVIVDGVPYTLPDGQSQIDAIDLDSATMIEVIRGPSSVLWGQAAGGVLLVTTADGAGPLAGGRARAEIGSDDYLKWSASQGGASEEWAHHLSVSALDFGGWRPQSSVKKLVARAKLTRRLEGGASIVALVNVLDNPRSQDPGALQIEEVDENRRAAAPNALSLDAGQEVSQQLVSLQLADQRLGRGSLDARLFYVRRHFSQQLPFVGPSLIGYARHHGGGAATYRRRFGGRSFALDLVSGVDLAHQSDDRSRFAIDEEAVRGARTEDEVQRATSAGTFAQTSLHLGPRLIVGGGGRLDRIALSIEDEASGDSEAQDAGGSRDFDVLSGSAGISLSWAERQQLWAATATSYETPTFSEFANPSGEGGLNPAIEPQGSWSREVGARGRVAGLGLEYDVALFSILGRDEILPYELDGRTFYRNEGRTRREGIETSLLWRHPSGVRLDSALTLARYRFGGSANDALRLPALPERTLAARLSWDRGAGRFAFTTLEHAGPLLADNANEVGVAGSWLVGARAGWGWRLGDGALLYVWGGVRNLLNAKTYANVRINASFGRSFEPAPGRAFLGAAGIEFDAWPSDSPIASSDAVDDATRIITKEERAI